MQFTLGAALGAFAFWIIQKLGDAAFARAVARFGRLEYVKRECGFFCRATTDDGRSIEAQFHPDNMFKEEQILSLRCSGDLFNDSDTQVILASPRVRFLHPDGPRVIDSSPTIRVDGQKVSTITVPAHGVASLDVVTTVLRDKLNDLYAHTIPFLDVTTTGGRVRSFRLWSLRFYGDRMVVWPRKGKLPVFLDKRPA